MDKLMGTVQLLPKDTKIQFMHWLWTIQETFLYLVALKRYCILHLWAKYVFFPLWLGDQWTFSFCRLLSKRPLLKSLHLFLCRLFEYGIPGQVQKRWNWGGTQTISGPYFLIPQEGVSSIIKWALLNSSMLYYSCPWQHYLKKMSFTIFIFTAHFSSILILFPSQMLHDNV